MDDTEQDIPLSPFAVAASTVFAGSLAAILAAQGFEHIGGYEPCPLCLQQRIAYYAALPLAGAAYLLARLEQRAGLARLLMLLAGIGFIINAGLGVYHSGVEWHWWAGPSACAGAFDGAGANLLQSLDEARVVRCDEAPWRLFGLSFAGWSAVISAGLAVLALTGAATRSFEAPRVTQPIG